MATSADFIAHLLDLLADGPSVSARKMFGEYALYANGKVVALVCDDQLFIKPTAAGRAFLGEVVEAPAYSGARPSFLVQEGLDDAEWLVQLITLTEQELPPPKPKKPRKPKAPR